MSAAERYGTLSSQHDCLLKLGSTWLSQSAQRTAANTDTKYLLLTYAFEDMRSVRVQFITDELNEKSRAAILRIGAKREGIVRHVRIMCVSQDLISQSASDQV